MLPCDSVLLRCVNNNVHKDFLLEQYEKAWNKRTAISLKATE